MTLSGTYEVTDEARLCFKWRVNNFFTPPDGCYVFRRAGDKTIVARGPTGRIGEMTQ